DLHGPSMPPLDRFRGERVGGRKSCPVVRGNGPGDTMISWKRAVPASTASISPRPAFSVPVNTSTRSASARFAFAATRSGWQYGQTAAISVVVCTEGFGPQGEVKA